MLDLECLTTALRIVRHGDDVLTNLSSEDHNLALLTMIDCVVDQVAKLSATMRGKNEADADGDEDKVVIITLVGATAEMLENLARHWQCLPGEAVRRLIGLDAGALSAALASLPRREPPVALQNGTPQNRPITGKPGRPKIVKNRHRRRRNGR